jgi:hypothetical protein
MRSDSPAILHPYTLPRTPRQEATWAALRDVAQVGRIPVRHVLCDAPDTYERTLRQWWQRGQPFVICEHDVVPTVAQVRALCACPEPWCAQAYLLTQDLRAVHRLAPWADRLPTDPAAQAWPLLPDLLAWLRQAPATDPSVVAIQHCAHRVRRPDGGWRWLHPDEAWADYVGFGLTKVTPAALPTPGWDPGSWRDLDSRVSAWTARHGIRWHIHWPWVPHYHTLADDR